ncbi:MAG: polyprenyl synthetase family protein [Desulfobacterales bacterium]|nr:polyprenyl synthetase family protein [Desulfobacterales bacterium]
MTPISPESMRNMMNFDLKAYLNEKSALINCELKRLIQSNNHSSRLMKAMAYSLMAGGKRIRPILCIAAAEAVSGDSADVLSPACALEMIHTYSLIHDDLPSMDNDHLRRGKPTCHIAFDESTALLAGDALLTLGFEVLSSPLMTNRVSEKVMLSVCHLTACAAGRHGMIEGQMLDMASEGIMIPPDKLEQMHLLKTGALIKASVSTGSIIGGGTDEQIDQLKQYAEYIGLAFQVADDLLDIEGDPVITGKASGMDANRNKSTYPFVLGIDQSKVLAEKLIGNALNAIDKFDNRSDPLRAIAEYIIRRNK